nr:site-specific DNA-methyltransferase [uncultured Campylobacter sp.]
MAKKDEVLKHKELGKVVVKQDNRDDGQKLKDFIKENISSMLGSDGEPDLGKIRDILGLSSLNGYELKFPGKGIANALYSAPIYKELKNIDENKSNKINENFIIKGDNLDALKILAKGYTNKIKMIYIDPPYNTMNNDFIYNDNFRADFDAVARISGLIDESGNKSKNLEEMERIFKGTRTHSAWLCFMYPRLKLARDLLKDDGVIFISIDDNEQANLKLLCDEIFGEENFIGNFIWQKKTQPSFLSSEIANITEYVICYKKTTRQLNLKGGFIDSEKTKELINIGNPFGERFLKKEAVEIENGKFTGILKAGNYGNGELVIKLLEDVEVVNGIPKKDIHLHGRIVQSQNTLDKEIANGAKIFIKSTKTLRPTIKVVRDEVGIKSPISLLSKKLDNNMPTNTDATSEMKDLFNGVSIFEYPKPSKLIKYLIDTVAFDDKNSIVLDFFAGSGTTAHAVMAQNLADNGNRKFILVQLDESIDEKKSKTAFEFCKNELKSEIPNISDITIERVKRAKKALNSQMEFSVYEMTDEPDIDVEENLFGVRLEKNPLDLVTNMLLKSGNEISGKNIECVIENRLYKVGNDYFVLDLLQKDDKELFKVLDKDRNGNVYADIYINCDIEVWLNFHAKFKERLRIL